LIILKHANSKSKRTDSNYGLLSMAWYLYNKTCPPNCAAAWSNCYWHQQILLSINWKIIEFTCITKFNNHQDIQFDNSAAITSYTHLSMGIFIWYVSFPAFADICSLSGKNLNKIYKGLYGLAREKVCNKIQLFLIIFNAKSLLN